MKYKILINSSSPALLRDFFTNSDAFDCMSTSGYWTDICIHYELFKPDAYVCLAEYADIQIIARLKRMKNTKEFSEVPVIVITNEDCFDFYFDAKEKEQVIDLLMSRPITITAITDGITRLLKSIEEEKERIAQLEAEAERKALEALMKKNASARPHILVVDDDKNVLKLLKAALEDNYDVTAIAGGKMALKFLETKTPDLIFLDYEMPVENGPEVFKKIKKMESARDIPVVFLTGVADREKITEVLSLKPNGYLLKPINMERVNDTIKSLLN